MEPDNLHANMHSPAASAPTAAHTNAHGATQGKRARAVPGSKRAERISDEQRADMAELSRFIRSRRHAIGLKQTELAEAVARISKRELSAGYIPRLETLRGMLLYSDIGFYRVRAIFSALGVTLADFEEYVRHAGAPQDWRTEQERALLAIYRNLSESGQRYLMDDARRWGAREREAQAAPAAPAWGWTPLPAQVPPQMPPTYPASSGDLAELDDRLAEQDRPRRGRRRASAPPDAS